MPIDKEELTGDRKRAEVNRRIKDDGDDQNKVLESVECPIRSMMLCWQDVSKYLKAKTRITSVKMRMY